MNANTDRNHTEINAQPPLHFFRLDATQAIILEMESTDMTQGTSQRLREAYEALMSRAPGAAFHRARGLYFNKYPLHQGESEPDLRLYVVDEQLKETIQPAEDGNASHRLVTLTSRPGALAIVHWQRADAPTAEKVKTYLSVTWGLDPDRLNQQPLEQPWFRDGGHQIRLTAPSDLVWRKFSLLTLPG